MPRSNSGVATLDTIREDAPLLDAYLRFLESGSITFTIPGHKGRAESLDKALAVAVSGDVPLHGGVDTIGLEAGVLNESERRAAALWNCDWCRFSTGGSTHGNQALALAVGRPGDKVLIARTLHRSALLGLVIAGLSPVWLPTALDDRGIPLGVSADAVRTALEAHPDARAVWLTEPSYFGTLSDVPAIVAAAHEPGVAVLVDQAWGAHFGFHPALPQHTLAAGADGLVTSAHKALPAYSQAALVLARTERLDPQILARAFDATHTTSPAGSILASIDGSRALLAAKGFALFEELLAVVHSARERLRAAVENLVVLDERDFPPGRFDPLKLVLLLAEAGIDGIAVEKDLVRAGVPVEMADRDTLIPIVTLADDEASVGRLVEELLGAFAHADVRPRKLRANKSWQVETQQIVSPTTAFFAPSENLATDQAIGRVSAEVIAVYPPGIPVSAPGEAITAEVIEALRSARAEGCRIAYAADPTVRSLRVLKEG